jgi:hypothetical protein
MILHSLTVITVVIIIIMVISNAMEVLASWIAIYGCVMAWGASKIWGCQGSAAACYHKGSAMVRMVTSPCATVRQNNCADGGTCARSASGWMICVVRHDINKLNNLSVKLCLFHSLLP